jgi:hypothetical protein
MPELIYNIKNIFSTDNTESCLVEYDAKKFHIAAYQRGYKWASDKEGAVSVLLNDLLDAFHSFEKNEKKEYYLQYITLKKNIESKHLEVIDGQQRLTTLSLLLSIISLKLNIENKAINKLDYAIRSNFFEQHIYNRDNLKHILSLDWNHEKGLIISVSETINNQDVFYLFNAAKKIDSFCSSDNIKLDPFYHFILNNVKIIVNAVDHISSEKVFSNLNSNKVPLTEAELIKGLLLTKFSRLQNSGENKKKFKEILEMRMSLGRNWDEITRWSNQPQVNSFFFKHEEGMQSMLHLVALNLGYKPIAKTNPNHYPLFNFYHKYGKTNIVYKELLKIHATLNDWFLNNKIYNLLGFLFFAKGSGRGIQDFLTEFTMKKSQLHNKLLADVRSLIPKDIEYLSYNNKQDDEIHRVLLALNVFSSNSSKRFNYHRFIVEKWTLEHIFPQTPEGKGKVLKEKDKEEIRKMLGDKITSKINKILNQDKRKQEEREIYETALQESKSLNSIGNMCLLTDADNISNGCGFFDEKRSNILARVRKGSFVPKHTFDVFSKMVLEKNTGDFERWTNDNIENHTLSIVSAINELEFIK